MTDVRGKGLARLYKTGGTGLLAVRLTRLFAKIETEQDRILHNDILDDVMDLINTEPQGDVLSPGENSLVRMIAERLLYRRVGSREIEVLQVERKKRFFFQVAQHIMDLAGKKK
jgi:hypothetical protein